MRKMVAVVSPKVKGVILTPFRPAEFQHRNYRRLNRKGTGGGPPMWQYALKRTAGLFPVLFVAVLLTFIAIPVRARGSRAGHAERSFRERGNGKAAQGRLRAR